jgi:hypothetical protein
MPVSLITVKAADLVREAVRDPAALAHDKKTRWRAMLPAGCCATIQPDSAGGKTDGTSKRQRRLCPVTAQLAEIAGRAQGRCLSAIRAAFLEIQSQLFQKFVTGGQPEHGSGLGLAFCKLAVEAHGQRIWVESSVGKGATFTFSLAAA